MNLSNEYNFQSDSSSKSSSEIGSENSDTTSNTSLNADKNITPLALIMATDGINNHSSITRLPPFNINYPDLWFNQVERVMNRNNINSEEATL